MIFSIQDIYKTERARGEAMLTDTIEELKGRDKFTDNFVTYLPEQGSAIFIGDTHGQSNSTRAIIEQSNFAERLAKGENVQLVFLGDYIDRGDQQVENIDQILDLKANFPDNVIILQGNHETDTTSEYVNKDFEKALEEKHRGHGAEAAEMYYDIFTNFTRAVVTANGVVAVHGCPGDYKSLKDLNEPINWSNILWSDPKDSDGIASKGNRGQQVGPDIRKSFLDHVKGKIIIRSHQPKYPRTPRDPFSKNISEDEMLLTVFSSGVESGRVHNPCYAEVDLSMKIDKVDPNIIKIIDYSRIPSAYKL